VLSNLFWFCKYFIEGDTKILSNRERLRLGIGKTTQKAPRTHTPIHSPQNAHAFETQKADT